MSDLPDWYRKPPLSPTERLRLYGAPAASPESILTGPSYDVRAHHGRVKALYDAYPYKNPETCANFTQRVLDLVLESVERQPTAAVTSALRTLIDRILTLEGFYQRPFYHPVENPPTPTWNALIERDALARDERFYTTYQTTLIDIAEGLTHFLINVIDEYAPEAAFIQASGSGDIVPFIELVHAPGRFLDILFASLFARKTSDSSDDLFPTLKAALWKNLYTVSGYTAESIERAKSPKPVFPLDSDLPATARAAAYLNNTPFLDLLLMPLPFRIPQHIRFEHAHVVAGSGHGKTQFLQHLILSDLQSAEAPSLVVIDSQGDMLEKIQRLALFDPDVQGSLADRIVIVDADDVECPPALNMFSMPSERFAGYALHDREQIEAGTIELFNYIFGALAAELTQKQGTAFAYVTRLMLSVPDATIHTLRQLMEDSAPNVEKSPFAEHIRALDPTSRAFFENQFYNRGAFGQTKQQIARRLYGVLQVPAFDRMFSSPVNKFDMFAALQAGGIVLINTAKALLKADASALFGRYMIALTLHSAFERVAVPEKDRRPAFLIVDEAAEYFDESLDTLLSQARKFRLGVLFAHQYLDQLTQALRGSVAANTSIKLAGGVSDRDARALAPDMRTTADFISDMRKRDKITDFACYVRNFTPSAVRLTVPFGSLEAAPKMTREAHRKLIAQNRTRYAVQPGEPVHQPKQGREQSKADPERTDPDDISTDAATKW